MGIEEFLGKDRGIQWGKRWGNQWGKSKSEREREGMHDMNGQVTINFN